MKRIIAVMGIAAAAGLALAGCATSQSAQQEQEQLRAQVTTLQSQVAALTSQVEELRTHQPPTGGRAWEATGGAGAASEGRAAARRTAHPVLTAKEIQQALQRAGYYRGPIDGKLGAKTRSALKTFQAANHLVADGVAGTKTMAMLQTYLTSPENSQ